MYPIALEYDIDPEAFWEMTLDEINEFIRIKSEKRKDEMKSSIMIADFQAARTREYISSLFGSKEKIRPLKEVFPALFDPNYVHLTEEEEEELEEQRRQMNMFLRQMEIDHEKKENGAEVS